MGEAGRGTFLPYDVTLPSHGVQDRSERSQCVKLRRVRVSVGLIGFAVATASATADVGFVLELHRERDSSTVPPAWAGGER